MDTGKKGLSFSEIAEETLAEFGEAALDTSPADDVVVEDSDTHFAEQPEKTTSKPPSVLGDLLETDNDGNNTSGDSRIEVNGQWLTIDELKSGYMMRSDYTKKTQELAQAREENANAITLWKALQEDPVNTLRKLNQQINTGQPVAPRVEKNSDAVDIDKLVEQKLQERLESHPILKSVMDDRARSAVDAEFGKIEREFNVSLADADKALILRKAQDMGVTDLLFVFSGLLTQAERAKAAKRNLNSVATNVGYRGDADTPNISSSDEMPQDFRSTLEETMRELKIESLT